MFKGIVTFTKVYLTNVSSHFKKGRSRLLLFQGLAFAISGTLASVISFGVEFAEKELNCLEKPSSFSGGSIELVNSMDDKRVSIHCRIIDFSGTLLATSFLIAFLIFVVLFSGNLIYIPIQSFAKTFGQRQSLFKEYTRRILSPDEYLECKSQSGKGFVASILGVSGTGKTLFRTTLFPVEEDDTERGPDVTTEMQAVMVTSKRDGGVYTVFDLPGNDERELSKAVAESEILIIFLDHNYPKSEPDGLEKKRIDSSRLREHEEFLDRLKREINNINYQEGKVHLKVIFFVLNKSDLWSPDLWLQENAIARLMSGQDRPGKLKSWARGLIAEWKKEVTPTRLADRILLIDSFSNLYSSDVRDLETRVLDSYDDYRKT